MTPGGLSRDCALARHDRLDLKRREGAASAASRGGASTSVDFGFRPDGAGHLATCRRAMACEMGWNMLEFGMVWNVLEHLGRPWRREVLRGVEEVW